MTAHLQQAHEIIERQAKNLARLIDDLLDVSRITQGKVELKREPVEVTGVIARAAQAVRSLIEEKRHELAFHHGFGSMLVDADPTRLEQVVANLLTNAAKYTDPGGQITISAKAEGSEVVIRVADTGVGIPPEMLPKIFDLFTQVDPSLARSEGGLGIGLSLVKQLVEGHGGTISARSELGAGASSRCACRGSSNRRTPNRKESDPRRSAGEGGRSSSSTTTPTPLGSPGGSLRPPASTSGSATTGARRSRWRAIFDRTSSSSTSAFPA